MSLVCSERHPALPRVTWSQLCSNAVCVLHASRYNDYVDMYVAPCALRFGAGTRPDSSETCHCTCIRVRVNSAVVMTYFNKSCTRTTDVDRSATCVHDCNDKCFEVSTTSIATALTGTS